MSKAYIDLLHYIKAEGYTYEVDDGEEEQPLKTASYKEAKEAIEAVEVSWVWAIGADGKSVGQFFIILPGPGMVDDNESVADWTVTPFAEAWWEQYPDK